MRKFTLLALVMCAAVLVSVAVAEESGKQMPASMDEHPMGPPPEMKEIAFLEGTWDVAMKWRMTPDDEWTPAPGTATYMYVLDGAAMHMNYSGEMGPNMPPFSGSMIQCFDSETKLWQSVWVDNMGAKIVYYTGSKVGDTVTLTADMVYQGQPTKNRVTTFNHSATSFDWQMEDSYDGGKTFFVSGMAKYTKRD